MKVNIGHDLVHPESRSLEVVERKGIGHPDTVSDGIAESVSNYYSKYCLEKFGIVLHHNVDKIGALGGLARVEWGSDELVKPTRIMLNGRISSGLGDFKIPVDEICEQAAKHFLATALPNMDVDKDFTFIHEHTSYSKNPYWFNPRSVQDLPEYSRLFANDTSVVTAHGGNTLAEDLTLAIEGFFYDENQKPRFKECGQDIKVMVIRNDDVFDIRVCFPIILKHCPNITTYWEITEQIYKLLGDFIPSILPDGKTFNLELNLAKDPSKIAANQLYALVGGSALDYGEEGLVGRGNTRSGFIPMYRTHSMEAAWGKNPVYHVGKVLGVVADAVAKQIFQETGIPNEITFVAKNGDLLMEPAHTIIKTTEKADPRQISDILTYNLEKKKLDRTNCH
jgi:S-adenosylmethionine synthetase